MHVNRTAIKQLAGEIQKQFHPKKIILFGSYAYGTPSENSDVDLLIVLSTKKRPAQQALEISRSIPHPFPMDIIVSSPGKISQRLKGGDLVLREILTKGIVLYETSNK